MREASFWVIGSARTAEQVPAVAIDIHDENGDLVKQTYTAELPDYKDIADARLVAVNYAAQFGVLPRDVNYDEDSTEFFADC